MMAIIIKPFRPWKFLRSALAVETEPGSSVVRSSLPGLVRFVSRGRRTTFVDSAREISAGANDHELARLNHSLSPSFDDARWQAMKTLHGGVSRPY